MAQNTLSIGHLVFGDIYEQRTQNYFKITKLFFKMSSIIDRQEDDMENKQA